MGTKQYERIFQILGAVLLAAVVVGVIAVCFGNGARSGVKREIGASDYYSQEEISAAMIPRRSISTIIFRDGG